jgi:uncharacterized SAM-binding protein YcdF (DUF218 family)
MYAYPIVSRLVHPYAPLVILLGLAIAWLWWKGKLSRAQRVVLTIPYVLLLLMSLPVSAFLVFVPLERFYPPMENRPANAQAIVILGGYVDQPTEQRGYAVPGADTVGRCLHGAALFREGKPCWVIVSGGKVDSSQPGPTVAEAMRDFLVSQGVQKEYILLEDRSGSTYENAVESAKILKERGFEQVLLVTDAASLLRAEMCFQRQGIDVIPSGCRYRSWGGFRFSVVAFLSSVDAADDVSEAWHEWLGLIWYWLRDRI